MKPSVIYSLDAIAIIIAAFFLIPYRDYKNGKILYTTSKTDDLCGDYFRSNVNANLFAYGILWWENKINA